LNLSESTMLSPISCLLPACTDGSRQSHGVKLRSASALPRDPKPADGSQCTLNGKFLPEVGDVMRKDPLTVSELLNRLEAFYGEQEACWPSEPYLFLLWWYCGYPASDASCTKGWKELANRIGTDPGAILAASPAALAAALRPGGMVPELRAERMKEVAARTKDEFDGDLRAALAGPIAKARRILKSFPSIADPGADRILLFAGIQPIAAVPSNFTGVLARVQHGREEKNYNAGYRQAQHMIDAEIPATFDARIRAYLLLKRHGQELCKRTNPKCEACPVRTVCAFVESLPQVLFRVVAG
jgi:endonuclease III